jgi:hypothetical protein
MKSPGTRSAHDMIIRKEPDIKSQYKLTTFHQIYPLIQKWWSQENRSYCGGLGSEDEP